MMPKFRSRPKRFPVEKIHRIGHGTMLDLAAQRETLFRARAGGSISLEEYRQYRDFHLGLVFLDGQNSNFITRRLWAGLWLPLGLEKGEE